MNQSFGAEHVRSTALQPLRSLHLYEEVGEFLLAFGLVLAGFGFGKLRDVHRAELRSAHGAEFRFLVEIVGERLVVHGASGFGIE